MYTIFWKDLNSGKVRQFETDISQFSAGMELTDLDGKNPILVLAVFINRY
ncbi:MAG: hypothetical protein ACXACY_20800 [Candidatus Hodarchaeales archaeon]|jgi:hypothetical protein